MHFGKLREVFVHNMPKKKNLLHFLHKCHGFRQMSKLQSPDPRRLAKALKRRKRPDPLHILAEASLKENGTKYLSHNTNPKKFWAVWVNFGFFQAIYRFSPLTGLTPRATLHLGNSILQKLSISRLVMKSYICSSMAKRFYEVLGLQKVKKQAKNNFLPHFLHTESSLGRLQFWRGKWQPNSEIPLGLESRHPEFSNKPTFASFGHLKGPQKCSQRRATRQDLARNPSGKLLRISAYSSAKRSFDCVWLFGVYFYPSCCKWCKFMTLLQLCISSGRFIHEIGEN